MEVLVTGADTDLGRAIAAGFREAGHGVVISGARRAELEVAAKELEVDYVVCDNTDPDALAAARSLFPHHLDTIVNVPAPRHDPGDPRTYTLAERRAAWHEALDATVLAPVLTLQTPMSEYEPGTWGPRHSHTLIEPFGGWQSPKE